MTVLFLILGSFLNVLIHRLPRSESIAFPPSHCPACNTSLRPVDLIPILSFLFLRGRCRYCRERISWRYPAVEVLTAILLSVMWYYGSAQARMAFVGFTAVLIAMTFIDIDHFYLPDTLQLTAVGWWVIAFVYSPYPLRDSLLGAVVGFGGMFLIYLAARGGMGLGDVKLAGVMGLYLGLRFVLLALLLAFISGAVAGLLLLITNKKGRKDALPFGPFLALGAYLAMLWGDIILRTYWSMF